MERIENETSISSSVVACIRYLGNVFTEPLPSVDKEINIQTHRLLGGIYEVRRSDGLICHDKVWLRHLKVDGGYIDTQTAW
jgi:hypothetical protein